MPKTRIAFSGVRADLYPHAVRRGCLPTDPNAVGWSVTVGGTHATINGVDDFAKHMGDFLNYAYEAGRNDARAEFRERLGL